MTHHQLDEPRLRALIARAVADEPGFDVADAHALDAAVAVGGRRRARTQASRGFALVAVAGIVMGGVALVRTPTNDASYGDHALASSTTPRTSGSASVPTPVPTALHTAKGATPDPSSTASNRPLTTTSSDPQLLADLDAFVRDLAAHAHGTVVTFHHDQSPSVDGGRSHLSTDVFASITTGRGSFYIDASTGLDSTFDGAQYEGNCSPSTGDLKPCTVVGASKDDVMLSNDYGANPGQAGRTTFQYVAATAGGHVLNLLYENYVEQPDRTKNVGPSWKAVGLDYATVRAVAKAHGLLA